MQIAAGLPKLFSPFILLAPPLYGSVGGVRLTWLSTKNGAVVLHVRVVCLCVTYLLIFCLCFGSLRLNCFVFDLQLTSVLLLIPAISNGSYY